jgi:outer membrane protein assembly factor BamB
LEVVGGIDGQVIVLAGDETSTHLVLDAATGEERWSVAFEGYGTAGTIDATTGTVYVGGFAPGGVADGLFLVAFDLHGVGQRWRLDNDDATEFWLVAHGDGLAYVTEIGEDGTTLRALDAASGAETWNLTLPQPIEGAYWSVAGNADRLLAVAGGGVGGSSVVAIDPVTGTARWSAKVDVPLGIASTTLGDGELVFRLPDVASGGFDRGLLALDRASGAERWRVALPGLGWLLTTADTVFVTNGEPGEGQALRALDVATGDERWNLGFPEFATLHPLDLAGATLLLSGANDGEAALIAVATA